MMFNNPIQGRDRREKRGGDEDKGGMREQRWLSKKKKKLY